MEMQTQISDLVVLVHGMGRTRVSMSPLVRPLERAGYNVLNWKYSSLRSTTAQAARQLANALRAHCYRADQSIHFVGHSLGCIIVRWLLANEELPIRVGRVVMLAPPNQGA